MFTDATYKACPSIFYQVWALHALVETTTIPLIVGMTANKSQDTYERIYRMVIERIPQFKPESFLLDMELANINAIRKVFPKCQIAICVFHLAQAIYRQVQSHGLQVIYRENPKVYQFVKNLVALAFVPVPQVKVYYRQVLDTIPDVSGIDEVVDYFERQYIEKRGGRPATIPIQWWNQHQRIMAGLPRSNNSIEAWHSQLSSVLVMAKPSPWKFIDLLREEFKYQSVRLRAQERGDKFKSRKDYREQETRLVHSVKQFEEKAPLEYLRIISYNFH